MSKRYIIGYTDAGYIVYDPRTYKTERSCNLQTDETRNYVDDVRSKSVRTAPAIKFTASDSKLEMLEVQESTADAKGENTEKTVIVRAR